MTSPVRYMAIDVRKDGTPFDAHVLDTMDMSEDIIPLCQCLKMEDALNIARAMNLAEGYDPGPLPGN